VVSEGSAFRAISAEIAHDRRKIDILATDMQRQLISICLGVTMLGMAACKGSAPKEQPPAIVGTWIVSIPDAPFPIHLFVFHGDGTVVQSNPEAGDPNTSDSNLMGVWVRNGDAFQGRIVEITADRATQAL
jgi:hypothetical protein